MIRNNGALVLLAGLVLALVAACGTHSSHTPGPTASADITAGKHIATEVLNSCAVQLGGKVEATPAATFATILPGLKSHSGRVAAERCLNSHVNASQQAGVKNCLKTGLLHALLHFPVSKAARDALGQSIFNCMAGVLAQ